MLQFGSKYWQFSVQRAQHMQLAAWTPDPHGPFNFAENWKMLHIYLTEEQPLGLVHHSDSITFQLVKV